MASEFFGMFFGNSNIKEEIAQSKLPPVKGENIETEINITIEDGFYGAEKKIVLNDLEGKPREITLKFPEGIQNGEKIRLIGQGRQGKNGGKNGDLYIKINIENGKKYKLEGYDLYTTIPISPWEAALGTKAKINSIDDSKTAVLIPSGIQSGEVITIPEKGYKMQNGNRGNLIAQIKIVVPEKLTNEEKEMFKKLKEISKNYDNEAFVLTGSTKRYYEPLGYRYIYRKILKKCDIEYKRYHQLRHTFATRCIKVGMDVKSLSEVLGHANVSITLNIYVHSSFETKNKFINKL